VTQPYVVTNLITGTTYQFYIVSRNAVGFSSSSTYFTAIAATAPSAPNAPSVTIHNNDVTIDWNAPSENGSTILGYRIYIQQNDNGFSQSLATCDGSTFNVIVQTACTVSVQTLQAAPFNLPSGAIIYAKIVAYNSIGDSVMSAVGSGAILFLS